MPTNFEGNKLQNLPIDYCGCGISNTTSKRLWFHCVAKTAAATEDEGRKKLITLCVYHSENCARASYTVFQFEKFKFIWQNTKKLSVLIFPFNSVLDRNRVSFSLCFKTKQLRSVLVKLSLIFLLISNLINRLHLHQFLGTCSPQ